MLETTRHDRPLVAGSILFGVGWGLVGLCPGPAQVLVSEQDIDYLLAKDYELTRTDDRSIGSAVSAFLSDSVLEGLMTPERANNP